MPLYNPYTEERKKIIEHHEKETYQSHEKISRGLKSSNRLKKPQTKK